MQLVVISIDAAVINGHVILLAGGHGRHNNNKHEIFRIFFSDSDVGGVSKITRSGRLFCHVAKRCKMKCSDQIFYFDYHY